MEVTESCVFIEEGACETVITDDVITEDVSREETITQEETAQTVWNF